MNLAAAFTTAWKDLKTARCFYDLWNSWAPTKETFTVILDEF